MWDQRGGDGGHPRHPAVAPPRPHQARRPGQDRAGPDAALSAGGLGAALPSADLPWAASLHRAEAALPGVRTGRPLSIGSRLTRIAVVLLAGLALVFALGVAAGLTPSVGTQSRWEMRRGTDTRRTGVFQHPMLDESSGVAASRRQPGILWTLNDSGNDAWIFATDTLGRDHGAFRVIGAENRDWEAMALGPCGNRDCLYIADTGDNGRNLPTARIYRVPEPTIPAR